jgi:DNA-binding NarL/FixJ family response regulator
VQILLYSLNDRDSEIWKSLADCARRPFRRETSWAGMDQVPDFPIVVVDQSVLGAAFVQTIASAALARPQQTFVATGEKFNAFDAVFLTKSGLAEVLESPLQTSLRNEVFAGILETADANAKQWHELSMLRELFGRLTMRERDVLDFVLSGVPNKKAAEELSVSVRTVEARRAKVYHKMQAENVVELVRKVDRLASLENRFASRDLSSRSEATDAVGLHARMKLRADPASSRLSRSGSPAQRDSVM